MGLMEIAILIVVVVVVVVVASSTFLGRYHTSVINIYHSTSNEISTILFLYDFFYYDIMM